MTEHIEVLIVGAGLSGVGAAYRIGAAGHSYTVLEGRDAIGGTWDLFRYPGIRSDSDMATLGYPFRPWTSPTSIADGPSIRSYVQETAAEFGIDRHIRFGHRVRSAAFSSDTDLWTVEVLVAGEPHTITCSFLYLCSGYYSYAGGHVVDFPGRDRFPGPIVHPQDWPEDLDVRGRRVVVIGSGATAVTLVPALAAEAAHVTMLQRSPSYVVSLPGTDALAERLRTVVPASVAHRVVRAKNLLVTTLSYQLCRRFPQPMARVLTAAVARQLPADIPLDPHFLPRYDPWDQRLCVVPDADLFRALRTDRADVVTDGIETFTETGIVLRSGRELAADVIVTATGLRMVAFGEIALTVDGTPVEPGETRVYRGMMFDGVPNLAWCVGYTNNSWTLRADLISRHVARILGHLRRRGLTRVVPRIRSSEDAASPRPILDLSSGYVARAAAALPKQGSRRPWTLRQNYLLDLPAMRLARVDDGHLRLSRSAARTAPSGERIVATG